MTARSQLHRLLDTVLDHNPGTEGQLEMLFEVLDTQGVAVLQAIQGLRSLAQLAAPPPRRAADAERPAR